MSIISDASFGNRFYLSYKSNDRIYRDFSLSVNIFIKEVRLYTFEKKVPFIKIKNTIFMWKNYTYRGRQKYYIKVRIFMFNINLSTASFWKTIVAAWGKKNPNLKIQTK